MELVHCIYCSASTAAELAPTEVSALLDNCRSNNAKREITGMLLYQHRSFFQVLEGDRSVVESLFQKILADPRHERVTKVLQEPIEERAFANWTMGYPRITARELGSIPGLNDFFASAKSYLELGEGRAKSLLAAFKDGQWRSTHPESGASPFLQGDVPWARRSRQTMKSGAAGSPKVRAHAGQQNASTARLPRHAARSGREFEPGDFDCERRRSRVRSHHLPPASE